MLDNQSTPEEAMSPDEAAQEILKNLAQSGYDLAGKVAISRSLRKLLRAEGEEAQKQLSHLLDSL